ncbi:hypothetical protein [Streptomyces sp. KL116D]|uniref:hypothetical protein n=1 Tax=Streptomyces sp. KL116D TaxID=3045152 RepID=UPI003556A51C
MNSDDILDQIDQALEDDTVSDDAMRSRPAAEPEVWIAPVGTEAGGEGWGRLEGISGIEIHGDVATVEIVPDVEAFTNALAGAYRQSVEVAARSLELLRDALRGGEWVDTNGDPVQPPQRPRPPLPRRDGRPAWQTPYGPARRR